MLGDDRLARAADCIDYAGRRAACGQKIMFTITQLTTTEMTRLRLPEDFFPEMKRTFHQLS